MSANHNRKEYIPELVTSAIITIFFIVARFVYYELDHGLRSEWTNYAFIPGLFALIVILIFFISKKWRASSLSLGLFLGASFALCLYLFICGVLTMASASSSYNVILLVLSILLYIGAIISSLVKARPSTN